MTTQPEASDAALQFDEYRLDLAGHTLTDLTGREIPLTPGEFRLIRALAQRPGRVLSRDDLLTATSGRDTEAFDRSIDMLTSRLRRKIESDPRHPALIVTVPGAGYKFAARVTRLENQMLTDPVANDRAPAFKTPGPPERRHLTVLQCVLSGPAFRAARQDPEDLSKLLAAFHGRRPDHRRSRRLLRAAIERRHPSLLRLPERG